MDGRFFFARTGKQLCPNALTPMPRGFVIHIRTGSSASALTSLNVRRAQLHTFSATGGGGGNREATLGQQGCDSYTHPAPPGGQTRDRPGPAK